MRLNAGLPVWHVSVSAWSKRSEMVTVPDLLEKAAIWLPGGVGGDREWWIWNDTAKVGHLRVGVTDDEHAAMPIGCAIHDAGDSGPERHRTRL